MKAKRISTPGRLLLAGFIVLAPGAVLLPGCSGAADTGPAVGETNPFAGYFGGSYEITEGPYVGRNGNLSISISPGTYVSGYFTDPNGIDVLFSGTIDTATGKFSFSGSSPTGVELRGTGDMIPGGIGVIGNGNFQWTDGNAGRFQIVGSLSSSTKK